MTTREALHAAALQLCPGARHSTLVGRDDESAAVREFVHACMRVGTGNTLYIAGPPGTGKTAVVVSGAATDGLAWSHHARVRVQSVVVQQLGAAAAALKCPVPTLHVTNALAADGSGVPCDVAGLLQSKVMVCRADADGAHADGADADGAHADGADAYGADADCVKDEDAAHATTPTTTAGTKRKRGRGVDDHDGGDDGAGRASRPGTRRMHVVVVDEVDALLQRGGGNLLREVLSLPRRHTQVIVIGISNVPALPQQAAAHAPHTGALLRGFMPTTLVFAPYAAGDLAAIVRARIGVGVMEPHALELLGKKVAATGGGDVRKAFNLARQAVQAALRLPEAEATGTGVAARRAVAAAPVVTLQHVKDSAAADDATEAVVAALADAPLTLKVLVLAAHVLAARAGKAALVAAGVCAEAAHPATYDCHEGAVAVRVAADPARGRRVAAQTRADVEAANVVGVSDLQRAFTTAGRMLPAALPAYTPDLLARAVASGFLSNTTPKGRRPTRGVAVAAGCQQHVVVNMEREDVLRACPTYFANCQDTADASDDPLLAGADAWGQVGTEDIDADWQT